MRLRSFALLSLPACDARTEAQWSSEEAASLAQVSASQQEVKKADLAVCPGERK